MTAYFSDISASYDSRHVAASLKKGSLSIWKTDTPDPIATVSPGFSLESNRQAVDPINRLIYSGTWEEGLTCFSYEDNRVVWHRGDLIGIQSVELSAGYPSSVFVTLEVPDYRLDEAGLFSGFAELDASDGSVKWVSERGDWGYLHPLRPLIVLQDRAAKLVRILNHEKREVGSTPMIHFAVNDVAFTDEHIALAEGEKGIRIVDVSGRVVSSYYPSDRQANCVRAAFSDGSLCVSDRWKASIICIVDPTTGRLLAEYKRPDHGDICFIDRGSRFVDSAGNIYRTSDGQIVGALNPPK